MSAGLFFSFFFFFVSLCSGTKHEKPSDIWCVIALRLCSPVAANSRSAARDTILPRGGGKDGSQPILVPKGTSCRWVTHALHRNKEVYGEDVEEFRPERWDSIRPG